MGRRFPEVDALRGVAITMMVMYHIIYDMQFLGVRDFSAHALPILVFGRSIPVLFLLLVGVSLTLSYNRVLRGGGRADNAAGSGTENAGRDDKDGGGGHIARRRSMGAGSAEPPRAGVAGRSLFTRYLRRGAFIFAAGMLITLATMALMEEGYIIFGILHLIGLSVVLAYPLITRTGENFILGALLVVAGLFLQQMSFDFPWLLWLGLKPHGFYTLDWFPLLPWFGFVLFGVGLGNIFYRGGERRFSMEWGGKGRLAVTLQWLGRHSLVIYLLHQPVSIMLLFFIFGTDISF